MSGCKTTALDPIAWAAGLGRCGRDAIMRGEAMRYWAPPLVQHTCTSAIIAGKIDVSDN